jgi:AcrR family transcriptional regulator
MTIEAVAARSGVAKTTIYRWWQSKGALAIEGFLSEMAPRLAYRQTGSVLNDLKNQLLRVIDIFGSRPGAVIASLIAEAQHDPETMTAFVDGYILPRRDVGREVFLRGIENGELRRDIDVEAAIDAFYGPLYYRLLIDRGPMTRDWADRFVEIVCGGLVSREAEHERKSRTASRSGRGLAAVERPRATGPQAPYRKQRRKSTPKTKAKGRRIL